MKGDEDCRHHCINGDCPTLSGEREPHRNTGSNSLNRLRNYNGKSGIIQQHIDTVTDDVMMGTVTFL